MENTKLEICKKCWGTGHVSGGDENSTWSKTCEDCHGIGFVRVPKTNADRIRAMSDEELEEFIGHNGLCDRIQGEGAWCAEHAVCENCLKEWLQSPAEEE